MYQIPTAEQRAAKRARWERSARPEIAALVENLGATVGHLDALATSPTPIDLTSALDMIEHLVRQIRVVTEKVPPLDLTTSERSTYQSMVARGYSHDEAVNAARDGVHVADVPPHRYGDSFSGMLCGTMVDRNGGGDMCGLPADHPVHTKES